jgi:hypothetical protein
MHKIETVRTFAGLLVENGCTDLHQTWHAYSLRPGKDFRSKNSLMSYVRVPMRVVSVAQKLSMIEKRRQDQSVFRRAYYRDEDQYTKTPPVFESR